MGNAAPGGAGYERECDGVTSDVTETKPPFWLVWNPMGRIPRFQHETYQSARAEADRLARSCPGQHFYILCPVGRCTKQDVYFEPYVSEAEAKRLDGVLQSDCNFDIEDHLPF